jgi:hypothetical protein
VVQLRGSRLKLVETDAANGVFLLPEAGGAEVKLPTIIENKPARLIALLPSLAAGDYHLEVRTNIVHGGKPSQALKIGRFNKSLSVGGA